MPTDEVEMGLPEKMDLHNRGSHIEIEIDRRWFGGPAIFWTAFALFWDGLLVFWYWLSLASAGRFGPELLRSFENAGFDAVMFLGPLLHVATGIWITYFVVAGRLNRTSILVSRGEIVVRLGPIPWPGNKHLPAPDIKQLWSGEHISRYEGVSSVTHQVTAVTRSGRNVKLVSGLASREQALYIEQEVEKVRAYRGRAGER